MFVGECAGSKNAIVERTIQKDPLRKISLGESSGGPAFKVMAMNDYHVDVANTITTTSRTFNTYRTGLLTFSSIYTFFFAGAFFGYGPMVLLLQRDEAFLWKCDDQETTCPDQTSSILNVHFVATLMQVLSPFVGHLCDSKGPFAGMIYTAITGLLGIGMLILSRALPVDQLLYPTFCLLGMCANASSLMALATGGIFRDDILKSVDDEDRITKEDETNDGETSENKNSNSNDSIKEEDKDKGTRRVIGLLNNLYDAGTVTYLILWKLQEGAGVASLQVLAYGYLGLAVVSFGGALIFWRLTLNFIHIHNSHKEAAMNVSTSQQEEKSTKDEEPTEEESEVLQEKSSDWKLLKSPPYLWIVAFFSFHVIRNQFMLTSSESFLEDLGDTDDLYITIFALIMPASIIGFPFVDYALGKYGYHASLQLINVLGVIHGLIQVSTDNLNVQVFGFVVFSFYRCFLFSVIFALLAVIVPQHVLGKANGLMFVASGTTGFINIPLGSAAIKTWNGSFFYPNLIYLIMIFPFFYAAHGATASLRLKQDNSKTNGEDVSSRMSGLTMRKTSSTLTTTYQDEQVASA